MIAVALDVAALRIAVAGRGSAALRRLRALQAGGAGGLLVFSDRPGDLGPVANQLLRHTSLAATTSPLCRLFGSLACPTTAAELAALARSERVLVNVEDRPALCDFHSVAEVRRGDLLLTVSTGGASPGLAARIRARLAAEFGPEWADRLALLRGHRAAWRRDGPRCWRALTDALLHANGWLA